MQQIFRQWIGMHRAMIAWFHAAHHVTKGTGFGGDHVNLYGEIYTQLDEDLDAIVEKGIGLTGDETLADPISSLSLAASLLSQQPTSANQDAETIARNAFEVIKYYVKSIESIYSKFDSNGMSLGLDDLIQGYANQYETYVYLLQQRSRTVSLNKPPIDMTVVENNKMKLTKRQLKRIIREAYTRLKKSTLREGMPRPEYEDEGDIDMEIQYYTEEMGTEVIDFAALRKYLTAPMMGFSPEAVDDAIENNAELGYIVQR